jgi:hypothetical protein
MVSDRAVCQVIQQALHIWIADCLKSLVSYPGNGDVKTTEYVDAVSNGRPRKRPYPNFGVDESQFIEWLPANTPALPPPSKLPDSSTGMDYVTTTELGRDRLIRASRANELVDEVFERAASQIAAKIDLAKANGKFDFDGGLNTGWRIWNAKRLLGSHRSEYARAYAKTAFLRYRYKPANRRTKQVVVTRGKRAAAAKYYAHFKFNGNPAVRYPPGRPPLTESEWLARYNARLAKRRKTNRRGARKVKAPTLKYGRPDRALPARPKA